MVMIGIKEGFNAIPQAFLCSLKSEKKHFIAIMPVSNTIRYQIKRVKTNRPPTVLII